MKVLILKPRLDVTFKKGPVPQHRGGIAPIRTHWANFVKKMAQDHIDKGDEVRVVELPLWQFEPVNAVDCDLVYVPHKEHHNFPVTNCKVLYYMQTVFPWLFTVNDRGWGAGMSVRVKAENTDKRYRYNQLVKWAKANNSKFNQPKEEAPFDEDFIFFPCQIPHDETIRFHSKISVGDALKRTADFCRDLGKMLVVKGHPVNPGSMAPLRSIAADYPDVITWRDSYSIHSLLSKCEAVFCVNSGVGMEALIHKKPVFHFGDAEYSEAAYSVEDGNVERAWALPPHEDQHLEQWLETWVDFCYDTR